MQSSSRKYFLRQIPEEGKVIMEGNKRLGQISNKEKREEISLTFIVWLLFSEGCL